MLRPYSDCLNSSINLKQHLSHLCRGKAFRRRNYCLNTENFDRNALPSAISASNRSTRSTNFCIQSIDQINQFLPPIDRPDQPISASNRSTRSTNFCLQSIDQINQQLENCRRGWAKYFLIVNCRGGWAKHSPIKLIHDLINCRGECFAPTVIMDIIVNGVAD